MPRSEPEGVKRRPIAWPAEEPITTALRGSVRSIERHIDPWETVVTFAVSERDLVAAHVIPQSQLPYGTEIVMTTLAVWREKEQRIADLETDITKLTTVAPSPDSDVNVFVIGSIEVDQSGMGPMSMQLNLQSIGPFNGTLLTLDGAVYARRYKLVPID